MVTRILYVVALFAALLVLAAPVVSNASYCGPSGCAPRYPMQAPAMAMPGPPTVMGPAPMACMPSCPPPCAPPPCGPQVSGFNPLSAVFSVITLPFRLIGGAFSSRQSCQPAFCPPPGCMPMCPPPMCGPQPIAKCKPVKSSRMGAPMMAY